MLIDESVGYIKNSHVDDLKDVMLISKYELPDLYELNVKEGMFQNTAYKWKTGVTKFIQSIKGEDLLYITDNLKCKKKCTELYTVNDQSLKLFKELRQDNEALVGIFIEQIFFYQI